MSANRAKRSSTSAAAAASTSTRVTRSHTSLNNNTTITLDTPPRRTSGTRMRAARRTRQSQPARQLVVNFLDAVDIINPQNETIDVQVVDLAIPVAANESIQLDQEVAGAPRDQPLQRPQPTRPVEVDLTCDHDLDDEPIVLLEDIMAHRHTSNRIWNSTPVLLGASPPRARPLITQTGHRTFQVHSMGSETNQHSHTNDENEVIMDLSTKNQEDGRLGNDEPQPSTSGACGAETPLEIQCPICLDGLSQMKQSNNQLHSTMCGHLFCKSCIMQVVNQTKQCPQCRQSLTLKKIHPIFI